MKLNTYILNYIYYATNENEEQVSTHRTSYFKAPLLTEEILDAQLDEEVLDIENYGLKNVQIAIISIIKLDDEEDDGLDEESN